MKRLVFLALLGTFASASPALGHVVVFPDPDLSTTPACGFSKFIVRVPTEKPVATTVVRLYIPLSVNVTAVESKPGWRVTFDTTGGRIVAITWSGGRIMPREFEEFAMLAAAPRKPQTVNWNAEQVYADKTVVRWNGEPGADNPHSQTNFTAAPCK